LFLTLFSMLLRVEKVKPRIISDMSVLGYASFCVYLFHMIAFDVIMRLFGTINQNIRSLLFVASIPLIFLASYAIQKSYDQVLSRIEGEKN
jgi:peptidoglycan/LPS O-acetylase OafA/YrhL